MLSRENTKMLCESDLSNASTLMINSARTATMEFSALRMTSSDTTTEPDAKRARSVSAPPPQRPMQDCELAMERFTFEATPRLACARIGAAPMEGEERIDDLLVRLGAVTVGCGSETSKPVNIPTDYLLMLDKSGSMCEGMRRPNMMAGLRALLQILDMTRDNVTVTLLSFDEKAKVIFGPGSPSAALEPMEWDRIDRALYPNGGTSIEEVLRVALDVAEARLAQKRAAVALLLTDGDDVTLSLKLKRRPLPADATDGLSRLGRYSGLAMHYVGICVDANGALLGQLAAESKGTFVSIKDTDIKGLMGSLLGLVAEKVPYDAMLSVEVNGKCVSLPQFVQVRVGTDTRVPFMLPRGLNDNANIAITTRLDFYDIGAPLLPSHADVAVIRRVENVTTIGLLQASPPPLFEAMDCGIVLEHVRAWKGEADAHITAGIEIERRAHAGQPNPSFESAAALVDRVRAVVETLLAGREDGPPAVEAMRTILAEMQARQQELADARLNYEHLRELSARCASDASTARNSGISIGDSRSESSTQAAMRSMSIQM